MRLTDRGVVAVICLFGGIITALTWASFTSGEQTAIHNTIPVCTEDAVLLGTGEFEDGMWTAYECGPARDDYQGRSPWAHAFSEWTESAKGRKTMATWLCDPWNQQVWYFKVERSACYDNV